MKPPPEWPRLPGEGRVQFEEFEPVVKQARGFFEDIRAALLALQEHIRQVIQARE